MSSDKTREALKAIILNHFKPGGFPGSSWRLDPAAAADEILEKFEVSGKSLVDWGCGTCHTCINREIQRQTDAGDLNAWMQGQIMILCAGCGNKRCPKATDHELECTGSNESGQPGSVYGGLT